MFSLIIFLSLEESKIYTEAYNSIITRKNLLLTHFQQSLAQAHIRIVFIINKFLDV